MRYRGAEISLLIDEFRAEDYKRLEEIFPYLDFHSQPTNLECNADITVWQGLAVDFYDNITINYAPNLRGTNAFIVDSEKNLRQEIIYDCFLEEFELKRQGRIF